MRLTFKAILTASLLLVLAACAGSEAQEEVQPSVVAAGTTHSCATYPKENLLKCWGANFYGQLGGASTTPQYLPAEVPSIEGSRVKSLAIGDEFSCAAYDSGEVNCWGGKMSSGAPVLIQGIKAKSLHAGYRHVCAVSLDSLPYCWGSNSNGQLGAGSQDSYDIPLLVESIGEVVSLSADEANTCAVTKTNEVWCWGSNSHSQLGGFQDSFSQTPVKIENLTIKPDLVAVGSTHVCALEIEAAVECWGNNQFFQLGSAERTTHKIPIKVEDSTSGVEIDAGQDHTCMILSSGGMVCWGAYWEGQLGTGSVTNEVYAPAPVINLNSAVSGMSVGQDHVCAALVSGDVKCWGLNKNGQLGLGISPSKISRPITSGASQVYAAGSTTCALTTEESVKCWGAYWEDDSNTDLIIVPTVVSEGESSVVQFAIGADHHCMIKKDNQLRCWGGNEHGQVGIGSLSDTVKPQIISGFDSEVSKVFARLYNTCVITKSGSLYCWGKNDSAQLGQGDLKDETSPKRINAPKNLVSVSIGLSHICALDSNGAVWCWGLNDRGQLGDGSYDASTTPVKVSGLPSSVVALDSGLNHVCALLSTNEMYCWGSNQFHQLGNNSTSNEPTPIKVESLGTNVRAISTGNDHACAILKDSSVMCWGVNWAGQAGTDDLKDVPLPQVVQGLPKTIVGMASGKEHSCAMTTSGEVYCWGNNVSGQLGNGKMSTMATPYAVDLSGTATPVDEDALKEGTTNTQKDPANP